ncbi:MAG: hypothetical protein GKR92_11930 [Gammaproteobacteria bacterium]|nr:MAG: hypothetical protein GKR92_11930 [Gammaproteobacteria bacterium]
MSRPTYWKRLFHSNKSGEYSEHEDDALAHHRHIHFLHTVLRSIIENPGSNAPFKTLLKEIEEICSADASAVYLTKESGENELLASTNEQDLLFSYLNHMSIDDHYNALSSQINNSPYHIKIIRLSEDSLNTYGTLLLKIPKDLSDQISIEEIDSIRIALSGILSSSQHLDMSKRVALHQERALIARELHDSLAQSLSYLKIQVSRLQALLNPSKVNSEDNVVAVNGIVEELRTNLDVSYKQLRELITTFRLALNSRDLSHALENSIEEFENRSSVAISLDNRLSRVDLAVDEEIHVLQIIREAISNVVRHSQASRAEVTLSILQQGLVSISIDDDGIGINNNQTATHRHGMIIMQQRAHDLGGKFRVQKSLLGGSCISVTFETKKL